MKTNVIHLANPAARGVRWCGSPPSDGSIVRREKFTDAHGYRCKDCIHVAGLTDRHGKKRRR